MVLGFVLVSTRMGGEREVQEALAGITGVVEATPIFGEYDLIVKVEAEDWDALGRILLGDIRRLPGVTRTLTLTTMRPG